ncbi:MAG: diacylglycerol kinase family protein [Coriobacteriales bacterium]|jgi:diacylglycerol kinase|nr:diacylglycerol kinase family protein [Coriobacteriales bacterium]
MEEDKQSLELGGTAETEILEAEPAKAGAFESESFERSPKMIPESEPETEREESDRWIFKPVSNLAQAFRYAFQGIAYAFRTQRNMRIHLLTTVVVLIVAFLLHLQALEWVALLFAIALVIGSELVNTAIEATVDLASPERQPLAKIAKDSAAAAVLIFALFAAVIGLIVFICAGLRLLGGS